MVCIAAEKFVNTMTLLEGSTAHGRSQDLYGGILFSKLWTFWGDSE